MNCHFSKTNFYQYTSGCSLYPVQVPSETYHERMSFRDEDHSVYGLNVKVNRLHIIISTYITASILFQNVPVLVTWFLL